MTSLPIGQLFNIEKGVLQSSKCEPGEYHFLTAGEEWKTHKTYSHECEALVFAAAASGSLGRTHYVNGKFTASDLCFILTPKDEIQYPIDFNFYHFVFNSLRKLIVTATTRGSSKPSINITNFSSYPIQYFDIVLQREWTKKLYNVRELNNNFSSELSHQESLLTQLRQAILREAVQGKLVPQNSDDEPAFELLNRIKTEKERLLAQGNIRKEKPLTPITAEEMPFGLPRGWVWCRLGEIVSVLGDGLHGTPQYTTDGEYYFINGNNLINGKIEIKFNTKRVSVIEYEKYKKDMNANSVLVSINGTLGNLAFFQNEKIILGKSACYFNLMEGVNKHYVGYIIKSEYFLKYAVDVASETTIKNVSLKSMRYLPIPMPSMAEQQRIVNKINFLFATCDLLEKRIEENAQRSELLLQAVLKEAFEGK